MTASGLRSCDNDIFVLLMQRPAFRDGSPVRIEPADRAVAAPVDNVHAPAAGVPKDHHRRAGQIELGDGGGDRKGFQLVGSLRHHDRIEAIGGFFLVLGGAST